MSRRALLPFLYVCAPALSASVPPAHAAVQVPSGFADEIVVEGLNEPNSMAFLPDGRLLVTEQRTGKVRLIVDGHVAATDPILTVPDLNAVGYERGLQGVAVDPGWPARPFVYLFYNRTGGFNRLVRYQASGDLSDPAGENLTLADPLLLLDDVPDDDPNHNSGCLRFAPDGMLFLTVGDDEDVCSAQDSTTLKGELLRLDVSGIGSGGGGPVPRALVTPPDNPLSTPDSNAALVYAYGMRNPWRFQPDTVTGWVYLCDVGEADFEEMNEVRGGENLGWPYREGFLVMPRTGCPEPGGAGADNLYLDPILAMARDPSLTAIVSAGLYRPAAGGSENWPAGYDGSVFYGEYYRGFLRRLTNDGGGWVAAAPSPGQPNATDWATGLVASVDFQRAADGSLWWLAQFDSAYDAVSGSVHRIRYTGAGVGVPPATGPRTLAAAPNPFAGRVELSFRLPATARVRLTVHDLAGRLVRTLADGTFASGDRRVAWDGLDARGAAVRPGLYLVRLERAGASETLRLARLR